MDDVRKEVLGMLLKAENDGVINKEQKKKIKECLADEYNNIANEILEDYISTKDSKALFSNFIKHFNALEQHGEYSPSKNKISDLQSPEDCNLIRMKKKNQQKNISNKNQPKTISNIEECEDGLSPTVVFAPKKK